MIMSGLENVWVLGLGDKDWGVFRSAGKTTSDPSAWSATDSDANSPTRIARSEEVEWVLAGYEPLHSKERQPSGGFGNNARWLSILTTRAMTPD